MNIGTFKINSSNYIKMKQQLLEAIKNIQDERQQINTDILEAYYEQRGLRKPVPKQLAKYVDRHGVEQYTVYVGEDDDIVYPSGHGKQLESELIGLYSLLEIDGMVEVDADGMLMWRMSQHLTKAYF